MIFKSEMLLVYVTILCVFYVTRGDTKQDPRQGKTFTFDLEDENVEVALDFSVPFVKIPFKKTLNALSGFGFHEMNFPKININPIAITLGGLIVVFTTLFIPILNKTFGWHSLDRTSRDESLVHLANDISEKLVANSRRCPERIACWINQKTQRPEDLKTLKEIMSNHLVSAFVNATTVEEAALNGLMGKNCQAYIPCPIEENSISKILSSIKVLTNRNVY
ncbi:uncharacterized protein LOC116773325 isoform X2 [Danaus plexippus]|uniref:uncharacterized protein LOC116773325 isoform X2 n=1 Tax=Danaus plexippus TaxID=13037 RepID=UPI002AB02CD9|nr:uncharacterized protein LOC116773325 isoform X2 [Danaus plexippus]